jgi:multiple sugar transport system substrate-binding protein
MKRVATAVVLATLVATATGFALTSRGSAATSGPTTASKSSVTNLTLWVGWNARELSVFKKVVAEWDRKQPNITVKVVGNVDDDKIVAAIRSGNAPDVVSSFNSYNVGTFCTSGAWIDLAPLMKKDNVSADAFPRAPRYYTQYAGKRCALPVLADTYGLYYNKTLFKKAGLTRPPRTMSELTAYAKKLTVRGKGGSVKVAGYVPTFGFYENVLERYGPLFGAKWTGAKGKSTLGTNPGWAKMLRWQKSLVDWYGHDKLVRFQAGLGDEFSASNAFETGQLAMNLDGEWRVAFIAAEKPNLNYGTAPLPVDDAHPELYGSGYINGTIIGIPKGVKHKDEAWALTKYLAFDTHALASLSNGIRNVPTTKASLTSPEIKKDARFATFLKIFANPQSETSPITAAGVAYTELAATFANKWQAGKVKDLPGGLKKLDKQIDAQLAQAKGPGVP